MVCYTYNATTKRMEADRSIKALRDKIKFRHTLRSLDDGKVPVDEAMIKRASHLFVPGKGLGMSYVEVNDEHATSEGETYKDYNKLISTIEALTYHYFNQKRI